jgi:hypothetical protein
MPAWTRAVVMGAALLSACGTATSAPPSRHRDPRHWRLRPLHGALRAAHRPACSDRVDHHRRARLLGGSWSDLAGRSVTLEGDQHVGCPGIPSATGCYDGDIRVSTNDIGATFSCVEETALVHEVGHAVIGDAGHTDQRWMDFTALALALAGRIGYARDAEVDCAIFVSVWRHPPSQ